MTLFKEIKEQNFPIEKYIVVGGLSMEARGLKKTRDADLVVSPALYEYCKKAGWKIHPTPNGGAGLEKGSIELYLSVGAGSFNPSFEELKAGEEIIDGIPFCSLEDVYKFKKEYNRRKDQKDVKIINRYFNSHRSIR